MQRARRHLTIDTESALAPPGPISITSGGTGVASIFPSSPATISISSGPHGDVTIMSGGAALGISGDVSLTASNANGGTLTFQSTGAFGVVAQFGAKVDITGATDIANSGVGAVLIGGDLTDEGAIGNLTNVDIVNHGCGGAGRHPHGHHSDDDEWKHHGNGRWPRCPVLRYRWGDQCHQRQNHDDGGQYIRRLCRSNDPGHAF